MRQKSFSPHHTAKPNLQLIFLAGACERSIAQQAGREGLMWEGALLERRGKRKMARASMLQEGAVGRAASGPWQGETFSWATRRAKKHLN